MASAWWNWSYDKRCDAGWYILHESRTVGYYPGGPELKFNTLEKAVAEFMVRELAESADRLIAWKNRKKRGT